MDDIDKLHKKLNNGEDVQQQIDRYCLPLMFYHQQPKQSVREAWRVLMPRIQDVFNSKHLYDMGTHIRALSANTSVSTNVFSRLIQYSLPYVKHNRLTFPKFEDVNALMLTHMIQIILACCLGVHQPHCKKPLWQLRFRIIMYMNTLLSFGSCADLYEFCSQNLNLLRISIIEYFVMHVKTNMPCEYQSMQFLFGTKTDIVYVFSQFKQNINSFRSLHMQSQNLNWETLNIKAHSIIEKCNRICKGKPRTVAKSITYLAPAVSNKTLQLALQHDYWNTDITDKDFQILCHHLRKNIQFAVLPKNVMQMQLRSLDHVLHRDSVCYSSCFKLHMCVRCTENKSTRQKSLLRTDSGRKPYCNICNKAENIVSINTLGRIVQCYNQVFYFCAFCLQVHLWQGHGTEFSGCTLQQSRNKIHFDRQCIVCDRVNNLHPFSTLDSKLGVQQHMYLCGKHQPYPHQTAYIHDLESLVTAVSVKCTRPRYI